MFEPGSRYASVPDAVHRDSNGRETLYKTRRFLPPVPAGHPSVAVRVRDQDRLDLIAARSLHNPLLSWRIADLNESLDPDELVERPGRRLRLPENAAS